MKTLFTTTMMNTGGRGGGQSEAPQGGMSFKIAPPDKGDSAATNPEQLFAAGYAACFNGALDLAMLLEGVRAKAAVWVTVGLHEGGRHDFFISADVAGHIEGLSTGQTEAFLQKAHAICPYSKATRGNIEVNIRAVGPQGPQPE